MNIGFIGAGKVGFSMGKYLSEHNMRISGYYSQNPQSAMEAAKFTDSRMFTDKKHLVEDSDIIFISVPDGLIGQVWDEIISLPIQNKIFCHLSGSLSSAVFHDIAQYGAYGYSIHPLFPINDKYRSYTRLGDAFFAIEGHEKYLSYFKSMFQKFGNPCEIISAEDKVKYHAAAAIVSNLYVGLVNVGETILKNCGFSDINAHKALSPLILTNAGNIVDYGLVGALTGPVERNDMGTVMSHIENLTDSERVVYKSLSSKVLEVARQKNPGRNYEMMEELLS